MIGRRRNRIARWLRALSYRVEWHEPECHWPVPGKGHLCGLIRSHPIHLPADQCPGLREPEGCVSPDEHHRFVR